MELQAETLKGNVKFEKEPIWGVELSAEQQQYLCEHLYKQPIVLTDHPKELKAFYMKLNDDMKTVACLEILLPNFGELIGGSARESRLEVLKERMEGVDVDPETISWCMDMRRYGSVPHAGCGLVLERLLLFITGLEDARDVVTFPRWAGRCDF